MKNLFFLLLLLSAGMLCTNAQTWKTYGTGLNSPVNSLCYYNNKLYAAGGSIYSWNGSTWDENRDGMILVMDAYSLAVFNGSLFSGGFFTVLTPQGNWYNNAARLYNGSWTTCGSGMGNDGIGMDDYVNTLLVYNGELYAGGRFGSAGGDPLYPQETPYIARFDGSLWHPVGTGMDFTVTDLAVYNNELIASGFFTIAGGVQANYIAKWNGSVWSPLGSGMDGKVTALAVYNGELYAGGLFYTAGGNAALSIAKWNGQSWSQAGSGIAGGGQVYTLAVYNNELYAGGTFRQFAGNAGEYLMKWNGSQWLNVGSGTDGPVVYLYPNGSELIIGGNFTTAGGIPANNIVSYTSSTGVADEINAPAEFLLSQNYPNPFNPSTVIRWHLPDARYVTFKVYDITGREVAILCNEYREAGIYETEFNSSSLPGGVYFYRLQAGTFSDTMKMILLR